ncbi:MAG TPA: alpha/beta hydrolase [Verrucomicrobiae bacterium]|nr:alpha/beta hydrolase [Verrucomicrobiae bacterium]
MKGIVSSLASLLFLGFSARAADGIRLENFPYPFPVQMFHFTNQQQALEMAYMDVQPAHSNAEVVVLLHGKNFCGAYWDQTATALRDAGYRVVIPDQIGFGKSSKPAHYQFSFQQLALNTRHLLHRLGVKHARILGHSMGGMVAARYALMFPDETRLLILVDPLGLEDWQAKGVPYVSIDERYQSELKQTPEKIRAYQLASYYHGDWEPEYDRWVQLGAAFLRSPDYPRMAWDQALTYDMIFTQPVCHEFNRLKMPVLLMVGSLDRTAIGKNLVPESIRDALGNYPELGRQTAAAIPHCKLVVLEGIGHSPHIEAFPRFIEPLKSFLSKQPPGEQ